MRRILFKPIECCHPTAEASVKNASKVTPHSGKLVSSSVFFEESTINNYFIKGYIPEMHERTWICRLYEIRLLRKSDNHYWRRIMPKAPFLRILVAVRCCHGHATVTTIIKASGRTSSSSFSLGNARHNLPQMFWYYVGMSNIRPLKIR